MEKKKVADVIKEILPVAVDIISDKLSKDDTNGVKMECNFEKVDDDKQLVKLANDENGVLSIDAEYDAVVNNVHDLAVGLIKYKPINKIVEHMNERGLSDIEKVEESYNNGFVDGFMMANCAQQYHIDHAYQKLSNLNQTIETSRMIIDQRFK